jgi:hypothetical protein
MSVWTFGKEGFAKTWKIGDQTAVRNQCVMRDGRIKEYDGDNFEMVHDSSLPAARLPGVTYDADGDVVMEDGSSL